MLARPRKEVLRRKQEATAIQKLLICCQVEPLDEGVTAIHSVSNTGETTSIHSSAALGYTVSIAAGC